MEYEQRAEQGLSVVQIAQDLESLSAGELEAVLEDLPLNWILDILVLCPAGLPLRKAVRKASMAYRQAIRTSDGRGPYPDPGRLEYLWMSLNQLAIFRYGRAWSQVETELDRRGCYGYRTRDARSLGYFYREFRRSIASLVGLHYFAGSWIVEPEAQAAFHYLPADSVLSGISRLDVVPGEEAPSKQFAEALALRLLNPDPSLDVGRIIEELKTAYSRLFRDQSDQLRRLADLYERFPRFLKVFIAPEHPANEPHILQRLRHDAKLARRQPFWNFSPDSFFSLEPGSYDRNGDGNRSHVDNQGSSRRVWYRFRYPHPTLVPFEWCLRLFKTVVAKKDSLALDSRLPPQMKVHFDRAMAGVDFIFCHTPGKRLPRTTTTTGGTIETVQFVQYLDSNYALPKPEAEIDWLESFITVMEWMAAVEFPHIKDAVASSSRLFSVWRWRRLSEPEDYRLFVQNESPRVIARQLQADLRTLRHPPGELPTTGPPGRPTTSALPSLLALYMPPWHSPKARAIAELLLPSGRKHHRRERILRFAYEGKIAAIREALQATPEGRHADDGGSLVVDKLTTESVNDSSSTVPLPAASPLEDSRITEEDLVTTVETLKRLFKERPSSETGTEILAGILARIEESKSERKARVHLESQDTPHVSWKATVDSYVAAQKKKATTMQCSCYICGRHITKPHGTKAHPVMPLMCHPCGDFNLSASRLSMPPNLSLLGKVAVVTGARVNLGYHVALRLLRCGAKVIASTRYPLDAVARYKSESDSAAWIDRLRVVGADFRSARDAFELAKVIRRIIRGEEWGGGVLHILINNAAQTLTDSIAKEGASVKREGELERSDIGSSASRLRLLPSSSYKPRIRAGNVSVAGIEGGVAAPKLTDSSATSSENVRDEREDEEDRGSSWVQSIADIPYEDVISAHSVNAFVPLILIRELLPLMLSPSPSSSAACPKSSPASNNKSRSLGNTPRHATGYIVNVSSREGIFENTAHGSRTAKNGRHVHTNMSKAALNMVTETEAAPAWERHRVAINTVDPGYMSAAPEFTAVADGERPITWEDGAGRVLWPVAVGELEKQGGGGRGEAEGCRAVWGRFLKHYGAVRVNLLQGVR
ncbi:hypothetical protein F5Y17DRAFT_293267 [Xylariaceae sp. FL0594]|nr:hypothetical protein F5Y17DRAFT_293267 [Xylariaceae sp. FL0594]